MPDVGVVSRFFALLALIAVAGSAVTAAAAPWRPGPWSSQLRSSALGLAWLVAAVATAGSLYYSEVVGFEPCRLCWYQRIAMYPLTVVLGIAAVVRDVGVRRYVVPVAGLGLAVSAYHVLIQRIPSLASSASCSAEAPCTAAYVSEFGFVTIPVMAGAGFLAVILLLGVAQVRDRRSGIDDEMTSRTRP